jgi:FixJ family two-component response regulator
MRSLDDAGSETPIVFIVDDDVSVRESLELLILSAGWQPETFASAEDFLARPRIAGPSCLVLDVTLPNLNGLELQKRIVDRIDMPIIFITGYGDVPTTVQAMKDGAVEFLTKPFSDEVLLNAIRQATERSRTALAHEAEMHTFRDRSRVAYAARTRDHGICGLRPVEQTDRLQAGDQRGHGEGPPRSGYAQDAGRVPR